MNTTNSEAAGNAKPANNEFSGLARKRLIIIASVWLVVQLAIFLMLAPHLLRTGTMSAFVFVGAPLGPLAGAIARGGQSCCMENSMMLLGYSVPFVALAGASFFLRPNSFRSGRTLGLVSWGIGCFGWMIAALLSLGHALS